LRADIFNELNPFKGPNEEISQNYISFVAIINRCRLALNQTMRTVNTIVKSYLVQIHDCQLPSLLRGLNSDRLSIAQIAVTHRKFLLKVEKIISATSAEVGALVACSSKALKSIDKLLVHAANSQQPSLFQKLQQLRKDELFVLLLTDADREFSRARQLTTSLMEGLEKLAQSMSRRTDNIEVYVVDEDFGRDRDNSGSSCLLCVSEWAAHLHAQLCFTFY